MSKYLVIVESPAKAKTIEKYLGKDFRVMASYGHVRDLIPKEGAVDPDDHFKMKYEVIERNAKHVDAIRKALKECDGIYLAPIRIAKEKPLRGISNKFSKKKKHLRIKLFRALSFIKSPKMP